MYETNTAEVMNRGLNCLLNQLGVVETERFISIIIREKSDYTKWRKKLFGDANVEEINDAAAAYDAAHPFKPKKQQVTI